MARAITGITDEPFQRHTVLFEDSEVVLTLRFHPTVAMWAMDVSYGGKASYGYKLALGTLHMRSRNYPFDFVVRDLSGVALDPFRVSDFSERRVELIMLDAAEMEALRGAPVPL